MDQKDFIALKPSTLIRVALADLVNCEQNPAYEINMASWHFPEPESGHCLVCLAGAVIARTLETPAWKQVNPASFTEKIHNQLRALNCFRVGDVVAGLRTIGLATWRGTYARREIPHYSQDREGFFSALHKLADDLTAIGY